MLPSSDRGGAASPAGRQALLEMAALLMAEQRFAGLDGTALVVAHHVAVAVTQVAGQHQ